MAPKTSASEEDALEKALEDFLRTGKSADFAKLTAATVGATVVRLTELTQETLRRTTWPEGIHAIEGQESNLSGFRSPSRSGTCIASALATSP